MDSTETHSDGSDTYRRKRRAGQTTERLGAPLDLGIGRVYIERRNGMAMLYARAFIQGRYKVWSTGARVEKDARRLAAEQFWALHKRSQTEQIHVRLFSDVVEAFLKHVPEHRRGEISDGQIEQYGIKWSVLKKHFENVNVTDVDQKFLVDLRLARRAQKTQYGEPVSWSTIQKDLTFVRLVLKHAKTVEKCLDELPHFPKFSGDFTVVENGTPYLNLKDYNVVWQKAKERMNEEGLNPRTRAQRQELYAFVMICVGAALRVGEAESIRWRDCSLVKLNSVGGGKQSAVRMMVKGKTFKWNRGKRQEAHGLYHAVTGFKFLQSLRPNAAPEDPLFIETHRDGVAKLLEACKLRLTSDGEMRTGRSLRPTGISLMLSLSKNPDVYKIAKWARTSVEQIQKFYDQNPPVKAVEHIAAFRRPKGMDQKQDGEKS